MLVWRIEDNEGVGPYQMDDILDWIDEEHDGEVYRPDPSDDNGILGVFWRGLLWEEKKKYLFGFTSLSLLRRWFSRYEIASLEDLGFRIVAYETDEVIRSSRQCAFIPKEKVKYEAA